MILLTDGLVFQCPFEDERSTCPFKTLRALRGKQKYDALVALSEEEKEELIRLHSFCKETHKIQLNGF